MSRVFGEKDIERKIQPEDSVEGGRTFYASMGFGARKGYVDCISPKRSTLGLTRTRTLTDFFEVGLISEKVYQECREALKKKSVKDEVDLLRLMVKRSMYYRFYDFNKAEQIEYSEKLVWLGILTESAQQSLLASYKEQELKTIPEILAFSHRYAYVELDGYEANPSVTYPVIFEQARKLLPDFHYTNLKATIVEAKESDLIRQDVRLTFTADSNQYTTTFFHDYRKQKPTKKDPDLPPSKVDQDWHKGINKWLTDKESPYRLYTLNMPYPDEDAYGGRRVGLLLLKNGEADSVSREVYLISRETFDNRLSKRNITKLIAEFSEQGFFSHLTIEEMNKAKDAIATADIGSIEEILLHFPKTIVLFDWETGNLENPYADLTLQLTKATRGAVTVSAITDEFKKGWQKAKKVKYGFTMNGKRYEKMLPFEGDWLAPGFLELFKKALKDCHSGGDIYHVLDNGQEAGYMFLTSKQHQFISEKYPDLLKGD
jgi:hypothetical protein